LREHCSVVPQISVLVVDDHAVFADVLAARLSAEPDIGPVEVAYGAVDALARLGERAFDVVVLDFMLGDGNGLEVAKYLHKVVPTTRVVFLTAVESTDSVVDALMIGVRAWLPKTVDMARLIRAMRGVRRGEAWLSPALLGDVLDDLIERSTSRRLDPLDVLTLREHEVLDCIAGGLSKDNTAARLGVSINTVRTHTQNLMAKLGVHSTLEAVALRNRTRGAHQQ
jgi:DNA-binding NarL/FixJ family response regulator